MRMIGAACLLLVAGTGAASAEECAAKPTTKPAIAGNYIDNFGGIQIVSDHLWISGGLIFDICSIDNNKRRIVALNDEQNPSNVGKFSRFDWISYKNRLWYCQVISDAPSEQAASAAPAPKADDPRTGGCGSSDGEWSTLIKFRP